MHDLLNTVEWRLEETLQAFEAHRILNQMCNKADSPELFDLINLYAGFWQPVGVGLQTALFMGINAILDKRSGDSATLYRCLGLLNERQKENLPSGFEARLDEIRSRYARFRHKLFGHNDSRREEVIVEFGDAGFSWDSIGADLQALKYALKVISNLAAGEQVPSIGETDRMIYRHDLATEKTRTDSHAFVETLRLGIIQQNASPRSGTSET